MMDVAGATVKAMVTTTSLHLVTPAHSQEDQQTQAPKMFVTMLAAVELVTVDDNALPCCRLYSWWIFLQSWGTMRFSDHLGLKTVDVAVVGNTK